MSNKSKKDFEWLDEQGFWITSVMEAAGKSGRLKSHDGKHSPSEIAQFMLQNLYQDIGETPKPMLAVADRVLGPGWQMPLEGKSAAVTLKEGAAMLGLFSSELTHLGVPVTAKSIFALMERRKAKLLKYTETVCRWCGKYPDDLYFSTHGQGSEVYCSVVCREWEEGSREGSPEGAEYAPDWLKWM